MEIGFGNCKFEKSGFELKWSKANSREATFSSNHQQDARIENENNRCSICYSCEFIMLTITRTDEKKSCYIFVDFTGVNLSCFFFSWKHIVSHLPWRTSYFSININLIRKVHRPQQYFKLIFHLVNVVFQMMSLNCFNVSFEHKPKLQVFATYCA